jgi:hypothetical protein
VSEPLPGGHRLREADGRADSDALPYEVEVVRCVCVVGQGCDEEGEPGCQWCRQQDPYEPCPADVEDDADA